MWSERGQWLLAVCLAAAAAALGDSSVAAAAAAALPQSVTQQTGGDKQLLRHPRANDSSVGAASARLLALRSVGQATAAAAHADAQAFQQAADLSAMWAAAVSNDGVNSSVCAQHARRQHTAAA